MKKPTLYLLCGLRGAGKTTRAKRIGREERSGLREVAVRAGARTQLHFLQAPLEELVRRVRARGGPDAETLSSVVLLQYSSKFQAPTEDEIATFDRYVGPEEDWTPR